MRSSEQSNSKFQAYILAIRPKTLFASVGPVLLGLSLAFEQGAFSLFVALLTLSCALLMQMGTNLVNDYFDFKAGIDHQERLGPTRVTQQGLLSEKEVKRAYQLVFLLSFVLGLYLIYKGELPILFIGLSSLLAAYLYTGGPFPLAYFALGEVLALFFFGPVAVWGTYYLQVKEFHSLPLIIGLGPGLISATLMAINNLRDRQSDALTNKRTLALFLGESGARVLPLIFILLSSFVPFYAYQELKTPWVLLSTFLPYLFIKTWFRILKGPINHELNICLAKTGKFLFLYCALFSFGILLK